MPRPTCPTCPVCLELFRFPVTLQCGHSVCKGCALGGQASAAARGIEVVCAVCREVSKYSSERDLQINQGLVDEVALLVGDTVSATQCHRCEKNEATLHCVECALPLCTTCSDIIHVGRLRQHNIIYNSSPGGASSQPPRCTRPGHEAYRTDLYCVDCSTLLCVLCSQTDYTHRAHRVLPVAEAAVAEKDKLRDVIGSSTRLRTELRSVCGSLDTAMETIDRATSEELVVFEHTVEYVKQLLDAKKTALLAKARAGADEQVQTLARKRATAVNIVASLNGAVAKVERAMRQGNHYELMTARAEMQREMSAQSAVAINPYTLPQFTIPGYQALVDAVENMGVEFGVLDDRLPEAVIDPSDLLRPKGFTFDRTTYGDAQIFSRGTACGASARNWETVMSSTLLADGVHYWEVKIDKYDARHGHNIAVGVLFDGAFAMCDVLGEDDNSIAYSTGRGTKMAGGDLTQPYAAPSGAGDVVGVKLNFAAQQLEFYKNGVSLGLAFYGVDRPCYAAVSMVNAQQVSLQFPAKVPR
eukprot:TRINITY_DN19595_c0_g1_i1.p1 TRINITY_DN19595_c0_g1~~TRINITY_DN19595_c0_g1_i1.p1  ORF type:complete len:528 (+),score=179.69 TRINITY_DN19595_c0_g1_i1:64-1647(+)